MQIKIFKHFNNHSIDIKEEYVNKQKKYDIERGSLMME